MEKNKMLTIREFAATGVLSEHATRLLVKQGKLPHVKVGNRCLINYDSALQFLKGAGQNEADRV